MRALRSWRRHVLLRFMSAPLSPEDIARLRDLLQQGKMIEAIKHFRTSAGGGLAEAKAALEQLRDSGAMKASSGPAPEPSPASLGKVRAALRAGNKIEAIKIYREAMGVGLKEAKDAVDRMETEQRGTPVVNLPTPGGLPTNAPAKTGCFGMLAACAIPLGALAGWLLAR